MFKFDLQNHADETDQFGKITSADYNSDTGVERVTYEDESIFDYKTGLMTGKQKRQLDQNTAKIKELSAAQTGYVKSIGFNADGSAVVFKDGDDNVIFTLGEAVADSVENG